MIDYSHFVNEIAEIFKWMMLTLGGYAVWRLYKLEGRVLTLEKDNDDMKKTVYKVRLKDAMARVRGRERDRMWRQGYDYLRNKLTEVVTALRNNEVISGSQLQSLEKIPTTDEVVKKF